MDDKTLVKRFHVKGMPLESLLVSNEVKFMTDQEAVARAAGDPDAPLIPAENFRKFRRKDPFRR